MHGYQISSSGNQKHNQIRVSVFRCFHRRNTDSPVLAVFADNTQAYSPAANNQPQVRPAHTWNEDKSDGLGDVTSLAAPPPEDGDGEGGRFGRRRSEKGGREDGPRPEGRGGEGRRPPKPGRGGHERGGRDDLVSSLAGPPPEGTGQ